MASLPLITSTLMLSHITDKYKSPFKANFVKLKRFPFIFLFLLVFLTFFYFFKIIKNKKTHFTWAFLFIHNI